MLTRYDLEIMQERCRDEIAILRGKLYAIEELLSICGKDDAIITKPEIVIEPTKKNRLTSTASQRHTRIKLIESLLSDGKEHNIGEIMAVCKSAEPNLTQGAVNMTIREHMLHVTMTKRGWYKIRG